MVKVESYTASEFNKLENTGDLFEGYYSVQADASGRMFYAYVGRDHEVVWYDTEAEMLEKGGE